MNPNELRKGGLEDRNTKAVAANLDLIGSQNVEINMSIYEIGQALNAFPIDGTSLMVH